MKKNLHDIVDIDKYPINDLNSPKIKDLIKICKEDLDQYSCSTISNFILPKSLKVMNEELEKQLDEVYMSKESINAYLYSKDDPSLPQDHPKRLFMNRYNGYLNSDCFPKDSTGMNKAELESRLQDNKEALRNLRFQKSMHQLENPLQLRHLRREIAQINTVLKEFELNIRTSGEVEETNE